MATLSGQLFDAIIKVFKQIPPGMTAYEKEVRRGHSVVVETTSGKYLALKIT